MILVKICDIQINVVLLLRRITSERRFNCTTGIINPTKINLQIVCLHPLRRSPEVLLLDSVKVFNKLQWALSV